MSLDSLYAPWLPTFITYGQWYVAPLVLRIALGIILIYHGWPKLFGTNPGLKGFAGWLGSMKFPAPMFWALVVAVLEFFGGIGLILGFLTHEIALLAAIQFLAILLFVKRGSPWKDLEFDLLIFAAALSLVFLGSGLWSINGLLVLMELAG